MDVSGKKSAHNFWIKKRRSIIRAPSRSSLQERSYVEEKVETYAWWTWKVSSALDFSSRSRNQVCYVDYHCTFWWRNKHNEAILMSVDVFNRESLAKTVIDLGWPQMKSLIKHRPDFFLNNQKWYNVASFRISWADLMRIKGFPPIALKRGGHQIYMISGT